MDALLQQVFCSMAGFCWVALVGPLCCFLQFPWPAWKAQVPRWLLAEQPRWPASSSVLPGGDKRVFSVNHFTAWFGKGEKNMVSHWLILYSRLAQRLTYSSPKVKSLILVLRNNSSRRSSPNNLVKLGKSTSSEGVPRMTFWYSVLCEAKHWSVDDPCLVAALMYIYT